MQRTAATPPIGKLRWSQDFGVSTRRAITATMPRTLADSLDPEDPAPVHPAENTAKNRGNEGRDGKDETDETHVQSSLSQRSDVRDDDLDDGLDATAADTLYATTDDEDEHASREGTDDGPSEEEGDGEEQRIAPAEHICQSSHERLESSDCEQERRGHPCGRDRGCGEVLDNGRKRRADDREINGREEHDDGQCSEDEPELHGLPLLWLSSFFHGGDLGLTSSRAQAPLVCSGFLVSVSNTLRRVLGRMPGTGTSSSGWQAWRVDERYGR